MHRYIVLIWDPLDSVVAGSASKVRRRLLEAQKTWICVADSAGLFAVHELSQAGCRAYLTADKAGVVFGSLFLNDTSHSPRAISQLPDAFSVERLVETQGRCLSNEYWGYYVAFANDVRERRMYAIRDCSGKLPCFLFENAGVHICVADFDDAVSLNLLPPLSINWQLLTSYLHAIDPHTSDCGFDQVHQLLAGEGVEIRQSMKRHWYAWDPRTIVDGNDIRDYDEARAELRRVTKWCIEAHSLLNRNVLLLLSGGFDSAVVLGCMNELQQRPEVTCLTRYANGPEEDERSYARLAAAKSSVPLIEAEWSASGVTFDADLLKWPMAARPSLQLVIMREHLYRSRVAEGVGATAIWSGEGGDHFFIRGLGVPFAADYARDNGIGLNLLKTIRDNARYSRISYWTCAKTALSWGSKDNRRLTAPALRESPFVNADVLSGFDQGYSQHPWRQNLQGVPLGKQWQISELCDLLNRGPTIIRPKVQDNGPLVSQPLMELCLRIPTYLLVRGGEHRALAREAFGNIVPRKIVERNSKGNTSSVVARFFDDNRNYVRELLLGGILAHKGLLVATAIDTATTPGKPFALRHLFPLMSALVAEVWVRAAQELCNQTSLNKASL